MPERPSETDICIVGAGLSGLALATALRAEGRDVVVLDARDRPGGRVLSHRGCDLGPSWVWPHNRRMLGLLDRLGLEAFGQYATGRLVFEDAAGRIGRDHAFATMGGALRVAGGMARVTQALAQGLGDSLRLATPAHLVAEQADGVRIETETGPLRAARVVLAMPPRLMAGLGVAVPDVPTWMAGHAKLVAVYRAPFWRRMGLNGDAISHRGPLAEIHDATPADEDLGALFGFAHGATAQAPGFRDAALTQLGRLFGPDAARPDEVIVKDWSADLRTATPADRAPPAGHPVYGPLSGSARILFAGTEVAPEEGGFLEGALAAAEAAHAVIARG